MRGEHLAPSLRDCIDGFGLTFNEARSCEVVQRPRYAVPEYGRAVLELFGAFCARERELAGEPWLEVVPAVPWPSIFQEHKHGAHKFFALGNRHGRDDNRVRGVQMSRLAP